MRTCLVIVGISLLACSESTASPLDAAALDAGHDAASDLDVGTIDAAGDGGLDASGPVDGGVIGCAPAPASAMLIDVTSAAYGATGDDLTDDTHAIQAALDAVPAEGATVLIPSGTYMIDATRALRPRSGTTLRLAPGATLHAITTTSANYDVVRIDHVHDVTVIGGTIVGERDDHDPTLTGEWGMGLSIHASQRVVIDGVTSRRCFGDGFYVTDASSDVTMCNLVSDGNRRQGMSITGVTHMHVRDSIFRGTNGALPEDGVDVEPNMGETVDDLVFTRCTFDGNAGSGIEIGVPIAYRGTAFITNAVVDGCEASDNGMGTMSTSPRYGITVSNCPGTVIRASDAERNVGTGIYLRDEASASIVTGNVASHNGGSGIVEYACDGNTITGNTAEDNGAHGVYSTTCTNSTISGNTESGNTIPP